jgi:alanyl-tRNA synthetase
MTRTSKDIRNDFISFFEQRKHAFVPSSPLLPAEDPTLLFTNAGMNQFKDIFLGLAKRDYVRAVNSQKCIRAGGKHNDLEDVGHDVYHHTFFEMLGNWSFGDYFKREAIQWAWELLTQVWGLPKNRLHVTVFEGDASENLQGDDEARTLWQEVAGVDPSHIHLGNKKDNFWEMGETGPCGPCSEIHYDGTPDASGGSLVNKSDPRVIEIWNLVFMQFNRGSDGKLSPLPAKHVDTGMGFERICRILNGKQSNYGTDLFVPLIEKIETLTAHRYGASSGAKDRFDVAGENDPGDVACRVIADHARALTFAIADGVIPSNEGRGYVLRRILRRAVRYGRQNLNIKGSFMAGLIETVVALMGDVFGELRTRQQYVTEIIQSEEESFGRTLDRGIELFQRQANALAGSAKKMLSGDVVFDLYATYGFPVDLTQLMAREAGLGVDMDGYEAAMNRHRELSGGGDVFKAKEIPNLPATDDSAKYRREPIKAKVLGFVVQDQFRTVGSIQAGEEAAVVLDRTNFYAEIGGQVGDTGVLSAGAAKFTVKETVFAGNGVLHVGRLQAGTLGVGDTVTAEVDSSRFDTMRNHTATHLLNWALRAVLGSHVNQAGSIVDPDRLRFDFTHNQAATAEQLVEVETLVNRRILADESVHATEMPLSSAKKISGVRAMFGEKYPDPVRVVYVGTVDPVESCDDSCAVEFCGGTHLERTSQVGLFKIISEESVAKGVRRITAVTGPAAVKYVQDMDAALSAATSLLKVSARDIPDRIAALQKEIKDLRKGKATSGAGEGELQEVFAMDAPQGKILVASVPSADAAAMRNLCDRQRQKGVAGILLGGVADGKVTLIAMVSDELAKTGKVKAGAWVKEAAVVVGGSGGGKDTLAQAGGKQPEKLPEALAAAGEWVKKQLV